MRHTEKILKRLERFKAEVLWSAEDTTVFKVTIIDRAIKLVNKEMNDLSAYKSFIEV